MGQVRILNCATSCFEFVIGSGHVKDFSLGFSPSAKTTTSKALSRSQGTVDEEPLVELMCHYENSYLICIYSYIIYILMIPGELSLSRMRKAPSHRTCKRASSA